MPMTRGTRKVWKVSTEDICDATGFSAYRVRKDIRDGVVEPDRLVSLVKYVGAERFKKALDGI